MCTPVLEEFDIPKTEFDIIMFLANNPSFYTAKDISRVKKIKPNVVSLHVDKLVLNGYLKRENLDFDRRKIKLTVTKKAEAIIKKGHVIQHEFFSILNNGLTDEDRKLFKKYIDIFMDNAKNLEEVMNKRKDLKEC